MLFDYPDAHENFNPDILSPNLPATVVACGIVYHRRRGHHIHLGRHSCGVASVHPTIFHMDRKAGEVHQQGAAIHDIRVSKRKGEKR